MKGKITQILEVETGTSKSGKEWKKGGFVIDNGNPFNPLVCFSLFGDDKINMIKNFKVGQEVEVAFNLSSNEFNGKWYHNIDAWKVMASQENKPAELNVGDESDELPF